jgi:ABC-type nickel/cobalt efflux system permease component RcnA
MTGDPLVAASLLGFVLGLQHATDADHLVAVTTIVTRERRFRDGARIGLSWGLGHATALSLAGGVVVGLDARLPPEVGGGLELAVAGLIVLLGVVRLRDALRGIGQAPSEHVLADHDHDGREVFHSHRHAHAGETHAHPHVHPSRVLLRALGGAGRGLAWRACAVGAVHGLAGTATISLLVLTTIPSPLGGLLYLLVFGLGTLAGMTALTAVMAWPLSVALRFRQAHRVLALGSGLGAIVFGLVYAA